MQTNTGVPIPPQRGIWRLVLKVFLVLFVLELILFNIAAWTGFLWPAGSGSHTVFGNIYYGNTVKSATNFVLLLALVFTIFGFYQLRRNSKKGFVLLSIISILIAASAFVFFGPQQIWTILSLVVFLLLLFQRKKFIN